MILNLISDILVRANPDIYLKLLKHNRLLSILLSNNEKNNYKDQNTKIIKKEGTYCASKFIIYKLKINEKLFDKKLIVDGNLTEGGVYKYGTIYIKLYDIIGNVCYSLTILLNKNKNTWWYNADTPNSKFYYSEQKLVKMEDIEDISKQKRDNWPVLIDIKTFKFLKNKDFVELENGVHVYDSETDGESEDYISETETEGDSEGDLETEGDSNDEMDIENTDTEGESDDESKDEDILNFLISNKIPKDNIERFDNDEDLVLNHNNLEIIDESTEDPEYYYNKFISEGGSIWYFGLTKDFTSTLYKY